MRKASQGTVCTLLSYRSKSGPWVNMTEEVRRDMMKNWYWLIKIGNNPSLNADR